MTLTIVEQQLIPDITAARAGDRDAFVRLIERSQKTVSTIALAIVKDLDTSEEIAQDVFIRIWHQLDGLRNPASFLPWVRQMTRYRAYRYLRDKKAHPVIGGEEAEALLANLSLTPDPESDLARHQQSALIHDLIDQLPERSREVVLLYYREEQSTQQVAALLGLSDSNVRKILSRARTAIREDLLPKYGHLLSGTAPGLSFISAVGAGLVSASPPAAAAGASIAATHTSGWLAKAAVLLGGAMLGALAALVGIFLGMHKIIRDAQDPDERRELLAVRRQYTLVVVIAGIALTAAYELTSGWIAPVAVFVIFIGALAKQNHRLKEVLAPRLAAEAAADPAARQRQVMYRWWCRLGTTVGLGGGFAGLIAGLIQSGRLPF